MSEHLFVYGTLNPDSAPAEIAGAVKKLRPVGPAYVLGHLYDLGDFPGVILDETTGTKVLGQVFELPDDKTLLTSLDEYEDFDPGNIEGSLFVRTKTRARLSSEREMDCWIYVCNRNPQPRSLIASGEWDRSKLSKVKKSA